MGEYAEVLSVTDVSGVMRPSVYAWCSRRGSGRCCGELHFMNLPYSSRFGLEYKSERAASRLDTLSLPSMRFYDKVFLKGVRLP